jgi:hypothetical protein
MRILALLLSMILSSVAMAAGSIGSVSENKGTACAIERDKSKLPGEKGASIESMDTYTTGACASSITFKDDSKVRITENSKLIIDDFVYDPKSSDAGKMAMKVAMGTVRFASGQIEKNNSQNVAVRTPTATIAVRGTDFTMTVDEAGQSLIVLLPSCKDPRDVKTYELEENRCKVGLIEVSTTSGTVTLDQAFHGTYVASANQMPTPPVLISTIESKINNGLIIVKPPEMQRAIEKAARSKLDRDKEELEMEAMQLERRAREAAQAAESARIAALRPRDLETCNYQTSICVKWDDPNQADMQTRGKGIAYREAPNDHYAEVKTQGYSSNTFITITQNDSPATYLIGDGSPGGNIVNIRQSTGVLRRP